MIERRYIDGKEKVERRERRWIYDREKVERREREGR